MGLRFAVGRVSCTVGLERHKMKLSISNPSFAVTKKFLIEDEQKMKALYDRRLADEFPADFLGEQFKGYVLKITGGTDKQGFAMMQGVLTAERVKLLLGEEHQCFNLHRRQKRRDTRKRKSVRGCITSAETSVLNMAIIKKGDKDIDGSDRRGLGHPEPHGSQACHQDPQAVEPLQDGRRSPVCDSPQGPQGQEPGKVPHQGAPRPASHHAQASRP